MPTISKEMIKEVLVRVFKEDPVKGKWEVSTDRGGIVWCNASSLPVGCCLQIDGHVVEDYARVRKDVPHINVVELEATIKGINLALTWRVTELQLMSDSASVCGWLRSISEDTK